MSTNNLWTFMKEKTREGVQKSEVLGDQIELFEKIPDIDFLEDMEVGALLNE
jgi:hypothetical protein